MLVTILTVLLFALFIFVLLALANEVCVVVSAKNTLDEKLIALKAVPILFIVLVVIILLLYFGGVLL